MMMHLDMRVYVVNRLLGLKDPERPNIHACNDHAFISACHNGHIEVVKRLLCEYSFRIITENIDIIERLLDSDLEKFKEIKDLLENFLCENIVYEILGYIYPWEIREISKNKRQ
jgi:hypothetical protein